MGTHLYNHTTNGSPSQRTESKQGMRRLLTSVGLMEEYFGGKIMKTELGEGQPSYSFPLFCLTLKRNKVVLPFQRGKFEQMWEIKEGWSVQLFNFPWEKKMSMYRSPSSSPYIQQHYTKEHKQNLFKTELSMDMSDLAFIWIWDEDPSRLTNCPALVICAGNQHKFGGQV